MTTSDFRAVPLPDDPLAVFEDPSSFPQGQYVGAVMRGLKVMGIAPLLVDDDLGVSQLIEFMADASMRKRPTDIVCYLVLPTDDRPEIKLQAFGAPLRFFENDMRKVIEAIIREVERVATRSGMRSH